MTVKRGLPGLVSRKPGLVQPLPGFYNVFLLWSGLELFSFPIQKRKGKGEGQGEGGREGRSKEPWGPSPRASLRTAGPGEILFH